MLNLRTVLAACALLALSLGMHHIRTIDSTNGPGTTAQAVHAMPTADANAALVASK